SLAPWLARYVRASTAARATRGEALQRGLASESLALFGELDRAGIETGVRTRGLLSVHTSAHAEEHAAAEAGNETGRARGAQLLSAAEARGEEPALTARVRAGVLFPDEADCDPVALGRSLGAAAEAQGVSLRPHVEAYALRADASS